MGCSLVAVNLFANPIQFRCSAVFNSEHFKQIVQLKTLSYQHASMVKGLVMTAACVSDKDQQQQYLNEILLPIKDK